MRIGLLVNPTAGRNRAARHHDGLAAAIRRAGHHVVDFTSPDAESALQNARARLGEIDALVAMGGDGTVSLALNAVAGSAVPLGIIPVGTGNDNATGLGLPLDPRGALQLILDQLAKNPSGIPTDAVKVAAACGPRWAMGTVSCGLDATVNERANAMKRPKGSLRYVRALLECLPRYVPPTYRVRGDDWEWEGPAYLVGAANVGLIGGGMRLAPDFSVQDGLLDVVIVDANVSRLELLTIFPRIFKGTHVTHPAVKVLRSRTLTVADDSEHVVFADGDFVCRLPFSCEVVPGAVNVFRPLGADGQESK